MPKFEVGQVIKRSPEWLQRKAASYGAGWSDAERRRNAGYLEAHKSARWTIVAIAPPKGNSLVEMLECVSAEGGKMFTGACSDWQVADAAHGLSALGAADMASGCGLFAAIEAGNKANRPSQASR